MNILEYEVKLRSKAKEKISPVQFNYMFNSFVNSYEEIFPYLDKNKNILDVGCGGGLLVDYLIVNGYLVEGCDNYQYDTNTRQMIEIIDNYDAIHKHDIYSFNSKKNMT